MERTTAGSDSERRRGSGRRHEPDGGSSGATGGGAVAALHGAAGNQAVGAAASDVQRQATASGPGTEATTASRDSADGLCSRCARRYRAGKPLDCPDCEAALQRSVDPGGAGDGVVQPKLEVSQPDDPAEREAERVADAVMRADRSTAEVQSDSSGVGTRSGSRDVRVGGRPTGLRRLCSSCRDRKVRGEPLNCEACERKLQRSTTQRVSGASADVEEVVAGARGGGRLLDEGARSFFEARFGRDFGDVRVHTGERADRAAASLRARAFTVGRDVFMRSGEYRPDSRSGRRLLAHELTHIVQQTGHRSPVIQRACADGTWEYEVDGCTNIPDNPTYDFNLLRDSDSAAAHGYRFGSTNEHEDLPCNNHDKCYQTCKSTYRYDEYGREEWDYNYDWKAHCDEQFRLEMREVCANELYSLEERRDCWDWAETYYDGVDNLGGGAFRERQQGTCKCENEPTSGSPSRGDWDEETRRYNLPAGIRE